MPTSKDIDNFLLTNLTKIINNQFITLQRSDSFPFFAVNDMLLLCWSSVNVFLDLEKRTKNSYLLQLRINVKTNYRKNFYENTTVLLS